MSKIAVILPSRGLMFSQTADEILQNLRGLPNKFFFSHGKPIPDCFEEPTKAALADPEVDYLWFIEDDMILKPTILSEMLATGKAVVTADYPINTDNRGAIFEVKRRIIFCGTGCLLVKRAVFDELQAPYFRTDIRWNIKNFGDYLKLTGHKVADTDGYGLHDVNFCMNLYRRNIPIHKISKTLGQRKLIALGKAGTNDGAHQIEEWRKVTKNHLLKQVKSWPIQETGSLVSVNTPTGEVLTSASHARKLIRAGLATKPPRKYIVVDDSEVL